MMISELETDPTDKASTTLTSRGGNDVGLPVSVSPEASSPAEVLESMTLLPLGSCWQRRIPPELLCIIAFFTDVRGGEWWRTYGTETNLCHASATCRTWRDPFQRQLYQLVTGFCTCGDQITNFPSSAGALARYFHVEKFAIYVENKVQPHGFAYLLSCAINARELAIRKRTLTLVDPTLIQNLQNLEHLTLEGIDLCHAFFNPTQPILTTVVKVTICDSSFQALFSLAKQVCMPRLRTLEVLTCFDNNILSKTKQETCLLPFLCLDHFRVEDLCVHFSSAKDYSPFPADALADSIRACPSLRILRLRLSSRGWAWHGSEGRGIIQPLRPLVSALACESSQVTQLHIEIRIHDYNDPELCTRTLTPSIVENVFPRLKSLTVVIVAVEEPRRWASAKRPPIWSDQERDQPFSHLRWAKLRRICEQKNLHLELRAKDGR